MGKVVENEKVGILVISFICNPITYYNYKYMYVSQKIMMRKQSCLWGSFDMGAKTYIPLISSNGLLFRKKYWAELIQHGFLFLLLK